MDKVPLTTLAIAYNNLLEELRQHEACIDKEVVKQIKQHVRTTHSYNMLECNIIMPLCMVKARMSKWDTYIPQRKRPSFDYYYKTADSELFCNTWGVDLEYPFTIREGATKIMRITINEEHTARCMYSSKKRTLLITFWYQPHPLPDNWRPQRKLRTRPQRPIDKIKWENHQQYWKDKL